MSEQNLYSRRPFCDRDDGCSSDSRGILAMAFVAVQPWEEPLCADEALAAGSAFESLVLPFCPKEVLR